MGVTGELEAFLLDVAFLAENQPGGVRGKIRQRLSSTAVQKAIKRRETYVK